MALGGFFRQLLFRFEELFLYGGKVIQQMVIIHFNLNVFCLFGKSQST